jgi:mono/diheme cytochrome c family protein
MRTGSRLKRCAIAVGAIAAVMAPGARLAPQAQGSKTVWDGVYSDDQAKRGRVLYNNKCSSCHGPEMNGGEMAPALVGIGFQSNWNGQSVGDLSERIRLSMPAGAEGTLSRQQVSDIIAAIFVASDYPAGQTELARESDVLKMIQITPRK